MKTALALCALGVAFAVTRASVSDEHSLLEERVEKAWASESSSEIDGGSLEEQPSAEAASELRAASSAGAGGSHEESSAKIPPPSDPEGQYQRALSFADIKSSAFDMAEAERWFTLAARQGHIRAAKRLGEIYRYGSPRDIDRALFWYSYPRTLLVTTGKLVGGGKEELAVLREAELALLKEKNRQRASETAKPMTAYEKGEVIGAALKFMAGKTDAPQEAELHAQQGDPKVAACRAEALKHITTCKKGTDYANCEPWGCPEIVRCDGYARACEGRGAPYNSNDTFFCDKRNWRTRDLVLENVLKRACPA